MAKFLVEARVSYHVKLGVVEAQNARKAMQAIRHVPGVEWQISKFRGGVDDYVVRTEGGQYIGTGMELISGMDTRYRHGYEIGELRGWTKGFKCGTGQMELHDRLRYYFETKGDKDGTRKSKQEEEQGQAAREEEGAARS